MNVYKINRVRLDASAKQMIIHLFLISIYGDWESVVCIVAKYGFEQDTKTS